ncbi:MAG TPA: FISUMP domain-containing protein [Paludibacter sp.]
MKKTLIIGVLCLFCTFSVFCQVKTALDTTLILKKIEQRQVSSPNDKKEVKSNDSKEVEYATFTDSRDGRVYNTVKIGTQTWMATELNTATFRNGDVILLATTKKGWKTAGKEKKPAMVNNLYNWYAVNDHRGIAPKGWHVPTMKEWDILIDFLGETFFLTHDKTRKLFGVYTYDYEYRFEDGSYNKENSSIWWWSSFDGNTLASCVLTGMKSDLSFGSDKARGLRIRCIKDE